MRKSTKSGGWHRVWDLRVHWSITGLCLLGSLCSMIQEAEARRGCPLYARYMHSHYIHARRIKCDLKGAIPTGDMDKLLALCAKEGHARSGRRIAKAVKLIRRCVIGGTTPGFRSILLNRLRSGQGLVRHTRKTLALSQQIDNIVRQEFRTQKLVGLAVGVIRSGRFIYLKGYGVTHNTKRTPVTLKSVFEWASISKTVTSVAAMQLFERKRLDLNKDIRKIVTYYPHKPFVFTMRQLLSNSSGLRHHAEMDTRYPIWQEKKNKYPDRVGFQHRRAVDIFSAAPLLYRPGTRTRYSTFGFILAGAAIGIIAQKKFRLKGYEAFVQKYIAQPARMSSLYPPRRHAIVLLCNTNWFDRTKLADRIAKEVLKLP